jgi:hypothetical protein
MFGLNPTLILGELVVVLALCAGCLFGGYHYKDLQDRAALADAEKAIVAQTRTAGAITDGFVAKSEIAEQAIQSFTQTQIIEVPRYVTSKSDARCVVPRGFVRLHDSAAAGLPAVPLGSGQSDDDPAGIELSAVADTVTGNYGSCRAIRQQLIDLQGWITAERASLSRFEHARP